MPVYIVAPFLKLTSAFATGCHRLSSELLDGSIASKYITISASLGIGLTLAYP